MSWTGWNRIVLGLSVGAGTLASTTVASAVELEDAAIAIISDADGNDGSVLVVTRKATEEEAAEMIDASLEPISQISEFEPELADPEPTPNDGAQVDSLDVADDEPRVAALPAPPTTTTVEPASRDPELAIFKGAQAGITTRASLLAQWGDPVTQGSLADNSDNTTAPADAEVLRFEPEPFERVETLIEGGVVQVIRVTLADASTVEKLTDMLDLAQFDSVDVIDPETGELLAVSIPERGLTLLTEATTAPVAGSVTHLVLQARDSQAFTLRAETRGPTECEKSLADLDRAIQIDAENAHAHWLRAGVLRNTGQAEQAEASAAEAVRLSPEDTAYQLRWAQCLADMDQHDQAVLKTRKVIDTTSTDIVRAEALHTLGNLATLGDHAIADKAIRFHTEAITLADELATSSDDQHRHSAKQLLVDAHLAIANLIARSDYPDKTESVAEWIGRASGLAEEWITNDGGGIELRLVVAREALSALMALRPSPNPQPWINEAEETVRLLRDEVTDSLFLAKLDWELGVIYQRAGRVEHVRGNADKSLEYGQTAIDHLSAGAEPRVTSPESERTVGLLYFYLGATEAVHKKNHTEATGWFDKARPILTAELPASEFRVARLSGERLVSMAVSYWESDRRDLALGLTLMGAEQMKEAVGAGVLDKSALAVPYGNLMTMHKVLGNEDKVVQYEALYTAAGGKLRTAPVAKKAPAKGPSKTAKQASSSTQRTTRATRPTARRTLMR